MPIVLRKSSIYTVRQGDTLYSIAQRFNSSAEEILRVNHLYPPVTDPGLIFPGDVLVVPTLLQTGRVSYIVASGDTLFRIALRFGASPDLVAGINQIENPNLINPAQPLTVPAFIYEIQEGDSLAAVSRRFGIPPARISEANEGRPGFQGDVIWPGYHVILPLPTSRNIVVWTPLPGTRVGRGQRIEGQARAFEANVLHQLRDANGVVVSNERFTTADIGAPAYGTLPFDRTPTANTGELWVYTRSAKDGSIQDLVRTTVYF
ncbi:LysM peptidoglycan-binding domain-containing protein [Brevibacillus dissolubilis]|uniref:LysM peptidoglycan-binding domain-containing protein n=1 Tax=Brevibacillus dissolubilis TaxID=1844116 RepID=UPI0011168BCD|nr:LysM peptidoglycan-binding domain-containing protein [Brevibacillus dissolubilis]